MKHAWFNRNHSRVRSLRLYGRANETCDFGDTLEVGSSALERRCVACVVRASPRHSGRQNNVISLRVIASAVARRLWLTVYKATVVQGQRLLVQRVALASHVYSTCKFLRGGKIK